MASNEYRFVHHWHVPNATLEEVADILQDALALPQWWPATYLDVQQLEPGGAGGIGGLYEIYTKGWLPYTLRWLLQTAIVNYPHGLTIQAVGGDFHGEGIWEFVADGRHVEVTFTWTIVAHKPLLRALSFALKPVFRFNHNWCMKKGEESLKLELARRRALASGVAVQLPAPPGPTFRWAIKAKPSLPQRTR